MTRPFPIPTARKPTRDQFGLPPDFDLASYSASIKERSDQHERIITAVSVCVGFLLILFGFNSYVVTAFQWPPTSDMWGGLIASVWFGLLASAPIRIGLKRIYRHYLPDIMGPLFEPATEYETALGDWNDRQLETGHSYWREKRGIAFESAVKEFLERRRCSVQTTKGSGDGGIDLIVRIGSSTYWCQCKGHAAPVGVAVIREIAGVCSRGGGTPVAIAVNGYTKSAISTANELGVILLDTVHLVQLARRDIIRSFAL